MIRVRIDDCREVFSATRHGRIVIFSPCTNYTLCRRAGSVETPLQCGPPQDYTKISIPTTASCERLKEQRGELSHHARTGRCFRFFVALSALYTMMKQIHALQHEEVMDAMCACVFRERTCVHTVCCRQRSPRSLVDTNHGHVNYRKNILQAAFDLSTDVLCR